MTTIENKTFDEERALYGSHDVLLKNSAFDGPADGESAFKESSDIQGGPCLLQSPLSLLARSQADHTKL